MKIATAVFGIAVFASGLAFAQSSGNFSATGTGASCVIGAGGAFSGGTKLTSFTANLSTGSGSGTTLDIRPSLVTGLFTDTKIDTTVSTASADIGIQVCVSVDGSPIDGSPTPVQPAACVTYDQRFQQISSQLFSQLSACVGTSSATACTVDADCSNVAGFPICNNPTGAPGAGLCVSGPLNTLCNFDLILSTLSAHSFDFVVPVSNAKPHTIVASWSVIGSGIVGNSKDASCVGPGILTVTQTKVFNNSGSLTF